MNIDRINALADFISQLDFVAPYEDRVGFNMSMFVNRTHRNDEQYDCGTPACIAGWATWLDLGKPVVMKDNDILFNARDYLDISSGMAWQLFIPEDLPNDLALDDVTQKQAAKVLRHLAATGTVDWSII